MTAQSSTVTTEPVSHMLDTFAFHIHCLSTAKPGDCFSLSFWGGVDVVVHVDNDGSFFFMHDKDNGKRRCVGNYHGAHSAYAELCAKTFESKE